MPVLPREPLPPRDPAARQEAAKPRDLRAEAARAEKRKAAPKIRVLLVDDSPSVRAVLRRFFARTDDIEVVAEAADGAKSVDAVLRSEPHVIVMDLQMPVMDGYVAIERIMAIRPTPIVVLSSRANRNQMQTAFEAIRRGAIEVLPKPEDTASWQLLADSLPQTVRPVPAARAR